MCKVVYLWEQSFHRLGRKIPKVIAKQQVPTSWNSWTGGKTKLCQVWSPIRSKKPSRSERHATKKLTIKKENGRSKIRLGANVKTPEGKKIVKHRKHIAKRGMHNALQCFQSFSCQQAHHTTPHPWPSTYNHAQQFLPPHVHALHLHCQQFCDHCLIFLVHIAKKRRYRAMWFNGKKSWHHRSQPRLKLILAWQNHLHMIAYVITCVCVCTCTSPKPLPSWSAYLVFSWRLQPCAPTASSVCPPPNRPFCQQGPME